ncbi:MAG: DUF3892 domain-containing protein [Gammaproteobacteria bacterium]|nr:DUF3892 domain-containing protein [Gammaproteobacteria bacterium]
MSSYDLCLIDDERETVEVEAELDEVIARLVNNKGKTIGYELRSGKNISTRTAFNAAKAGLLKDVESAKRGQTLYIRAAKDASTDNNLKNLITRTFAIETGFDSL